MDIKFDLFERVYGVGYYGVAAGEITQIKVHKDIRGTSIHYYVKRQDKPENSIFHLEDCIYKGLEQAERAYKRMEKEDKLCG